MKNPTRAEIEPDGMDAEAERLVAALEDLMEGEGVVTALVAMGRRAVAPLRRCLLHGRVSTVFQPRQWAVRALGGLGAREVLMEYLSSQRPGDPQLRFADEAVRNTAVLEFLRWPDKITKAFLLSISETTMLAGLAECFGRMRVEEAIPFLDHALEDDVCRLPAEEALVAIGATAADAMINSAVRGYRACNTDPPSSLLRRRAALRVLSEIGIRREDWPRLELLMKDEDPEVVVRTCTLAVRAGIEEAATPGILALIAIAPVLPWYLCEDLVDCLVAWKDQGLPIVDAEVERRLKTPRIEQIQDQTLRLLLRVQRFAQGS